MDIISDDDLSAVAGRAGITVSINEPAAGIAATSAGWLSTDPNSAQQNEVGEKGVRANNLNWKRLDTSRSLLDFSVDAFSDGSALPGLAMSFDWARSRLDVGSVTLAGPGSGSFGRYVIDAPGRLQLVGLNGFLNASNPTYGSSGYLNIGKVDPTLWAVGTMGATDPGAIYWHQGTTELSMGSFSFYFGIPDGRMGINNKGILLESKPGTPIAFSLSLDFMLDSNSTSPLAVDASDKSILYWGWRGHQQDFQLQLGSGGRFDGSGHGLTGNIHFNYQPDFAWIVGQGGSSTTSFKIEFSDWTVLPGNTYGLDIPGLTLDAVTGAQGTTGLCWGSNAVSATANGGCSGTGMGDYASNWNVSTLQVRQATDPDALVLGVRDMYLAAYAAKVDVLDRTVDTNKASRPFNWALIYTLANLDADIFVSPAADGKSQRLDLALTSQTLGAGATDRWQHGGNFMIADTDSNFGIGLMGVDVLMALRGARLSLEPTGIVMDSNLMRYQLRGLFGGGDIPNMNVPQAMTYADLNVEADRYHLKLGSGSAAVANGTSNYLTYDGYIHLANLNQANFANPAATAGNHMHDDGSYLSLAEPHSSMVDVDFRLADVTGPVEIKNGKLMLQGDVDGLSDPQLRIYNDLYVGTSATDPCVGGALPCVASAATDPLKVGRLEFGGKNLGTLVMPSGIIRAQLTLMPQIP